MAHRCSVEQVIQNASRSFRTIVAFRSVAGAFIRFEATGCGTNKSIQGRALYQRLGSNVSAGGADDLSAGTSACAYHGEEAASHPQTGGNGYLVDGLRGESADGLHGESFDRFCPGGSRSSYLCPSSHRKLSRNNHYTSQSRGSCPTPSLHSHTCLIHSQPAARLPTQGQEAGSNVSWQSLSLHEGAKLPKTAIASSV